MSYEKVKSICITKDKVFITGASNNVRPLTYYKEEFPYFTKILKEKGKEETEISLLKSYEEGNLQDGNNKYTKALKVLRYFYQEEYKRFNWRCHNNKYGSVEDKKDEELRESQEFKDLLRKALNYKFSKTKFIITKKTYDGVVYGKKTLRSMKWLYNKDKATKYDFIQEAESNKDDFPEHINNDWIIEEIK